MIYQSHTRTLLATFLCLAFAAAATGGDDNTRRNSLSHCASFWVFEAGGSYPFSLDSVNTRKNDKWHEYLLYSAESALLFTMNNRYALGGSLFLDYDVYVNSAQMGVRVRSRVWLSDVIGVAISPGLILSGSHSEGLRFSGTAAINVTQILAFTIRLDDLEPGHRSGEGMALSAGVLLRVNFGCSINADKQDGGTPMISESNLQGMSRTHAD